MHKLAALAAWEIIVKEIDLFQALWERNRTTLEAVLAETFNKSANDNEGEMALPQSGSDVSRLIVNELLAFTFNNTGADSVVQLASHLAQQGLVLVAGARLMMAIGSVLEAVPEGGGLTPIMFRQLTQFQMHFMESLAEARRDVNLERQERSQDALRQALHTQLDQQRHMRRAQEKRNLSLNRVLQLNARLAGITDAAVLLSEAADGVRKALSLQSVEICLQSDDTNQWATRASSDAPEMADTALPFAAEQLLSMALRSNGESVKRGFTEEGVFPFAVGMVFEIGRDTHGGIVFQGTETESSGVEETLILLRTFAQNLSATWRNHLLLSETQQRAKELEILHGRHVDRIWNTETAALYAKLDGSGLRFESEPATPAANDTTFPIRVGDRRVGKVRLPATAYLSKQDAEFVDSLVREMGNALNTAYLLQTTNATSNQLALAAEVSRAVSTILDHGKLIQEVVDMIRARFDFYFVGLFTLDEDAGEAVLQAGTGEAGRLQVERGHRLAVGGNSMIGTAIATGEALVEQDISKARVFSSNPHLPETRSELAVPLRLRGRVTGALTVQSTEVGAFSSEAVSVLQSLGDQMAVAIANAELFAQIQENLAETSSLYEASRLVGQAADPTDVYEALVGFAQRSGQVDMAHVIVADPAAPDYLISPVLWSRHPTPFDPSDRFPRDRFLAGERLLQNRLLSFVDGQTDSTLDALSRRLYRSTKLHSSAMIPMHVDEEWLGTLAIHRADVDPFTDEDLQPFVTLAHQSAIILANQRLLTQTESLYRIGRTLSESLTRDDALEAAVKELIDYTGAAQCRVVLYDAAASAGSMVAAFQESDQWPSLTFPMFGDHVYESFVREGQPLILDAHDEALPHSVKQLYLEKFGTHTSLLVPAYSQQVLIGFIALDSHLGVNPFTAARIKFVQTVADQLTTQLDNLKLLDEAISRAQELITLNHIQSQIAGILDVDGLANAVYRQIGDLMDCSGFLLSLYDAPTRQYRPIKQVIDGRTIPTEVRALSQSEALFGFLIAGQSALVDQSSAIMREVVPDSDSDRSMSAIWVPLLHEDLPIGLISVQSADASAYSANEVQLLRSIATQTSLAIANAQLFAEIQASYEQLRQVDTMKTQFLAKMSHELRTPLNAIIGFSRIMMKGIDGPVNQQQEEDLGSIYKNGLHLLSLINEILDMAKIEAGKMILAFEQVNLGDIIKESLTSTRSLINESRVTLVYEERDDLPELEADPLRLRQILMNLLSNAAKYTESGTISLSVHRQTDQVHLIVADTGIGIGPDDHAKLFQAFEQVDNSTTRTVGGTGLGLPITKWLVQSHGGRIWFESEVGRGTTFHVTLPLVQAVDTAVVDHAL